MSGSDMKTSKTFLTLGQKLKLKIQYRYSVFEKDKVCQTTKHKQQV